LIAAADARPFDPMIGCWSGQGQAYDQDGVPQGPLNSTGSVKWNAQYTEMHFKQPPLDFHLTVTGKVAKFRSDDIDVTGVEMDPRTYEFVLRFKKNTHPQFGTWYNVHYFTSKSQRLVMGGFQAGNDNEPSAVERLATQRLTRVACPTQPSVARRQPN
jgi:hypothetical protein